jgi:hypothetical protein
LLGASKKAKPHLSAQNQITTTMAMSQMDTMEKAVVAESQRRDNETKALVANLKEDTARFEECHKKDMADLSRHHKAAMRAS